MLCLNHITKDYLAGDAPVHALRDVSIAFRENEFVSILGPSGCGKTTLLNIIGGLDHYTDGDLSIGGVSTRDYHDADWDAYRNHSIGFVFQSYNLIPHQSVLANVELALTLSGVSKTERRARAKAALEQVGLGDQLRKRPNQMSGGQMQRVAIARALVNDPEILLADEPTGALDSETSTQVMELLRQVAKDRLVIMVTHNAELADEYSTRIVRLLDGQVIGDTNPYDPAAEAEAVREAEAAPEPETREKARKKPSMSFLTALNLSTNNLLTKKGRTLLTAFAGSIGIIGIALILSLSNGVQNYIDQVQEDTLTSYPITIQAEETDMSSLMASLMGVQMEARDAHELDAVYSNSVMRQLLDTMLNADVRTNNLTDFKTFLDDMDHNGLRDYVSNLQYSYDLNLNVYAKDPEGAWSKSDVLELWENMMGGGDSPYASMAELSASYSRFSNLGIWRELQAGEDAPVAASVREDYDLLYGHWPEAYDQVVLILSPQNEISDLALYCLGLVSGQTMTEQMNLALEEQVVNTEQARWDYDEICGIDLRLLLESDYYVQSGEGWESIEDNETLLGMAVDNGVKLTITGILRPVDEDSPETGTLGYTSALTRYVIEQTNQSPVVQAQRETPDFDILAGLPFATQGSEPTDEEKAAQITDYLTALSDGEKTELYLEIMAQPEEAMVQQALEETMAMMPDRESMLQAVTSQYAMQAGVDTDTILSYLQNMSDQELEDMMTRTVRQQIEAQLTAQARQGILEQAAALAADAGTGDGLREAADQIAQQVLAQTTKIEYICGQYLQTTALDAQTIYLWLMNLSQEELDQIFDDMMLQLAEAYTGGAAALDPQALAPYIAPWLDEYLAQADRKTLADLYDGYMPPSTSESTLEDNLKTLGVLDLDSPSSVNIYVSTFAAKDAVAEIIAGYNQDKAEEDQISYTDYVALLMSSITRVINAISYVLVAFVSISLVVSSIMIGIITYISVLERTKEIGILRAMGAAKRDVARVFNAETLIVGFAAGVIGIGVTLLLNIPINLIVHRLTDISNLRSTLPWQGGVALVIISMGLTLLAGLIPSRIAARKDPVEALRTE